MPGRYGTGLAPDWAQRTDHYGLRWLAERVQALHGRLDVEAAAPHGAQLRLRVPLPTDSRPTQEME